MLDVGIVISTDVTFVTLCRAETTSVLNNISFRVVKTLDAKVYDDVVSVVSAINESVHRNPIWLLGWSTP